MNCERTNAGIKTLSRRSCLRGAGAFLLFALHGGCGPDSGDRILLRPRFYMEAAGAVPIFDEYDVVGVELFQVDNPFPDALNKRIYALYFQLDHRSAFALSAETVKNKGKSIFMLIAGERMGYHPIAGPLNNGTLKIYLPTRVTEEAARKIHEELQRTIVETQRELQRKRGKW